MWYLPSLLDNPVRRVFLWNIVMNSKKEWIESYREGKWPDTIEGVDERLNKSIQDEGIFSKMKEGLEHDRFRYWGLKGELCDINLLVLGINLNKLHKKLLNNQYEIIKYKKSRLRINLHQNYKELRKKRECIRI